MSINTGVELPGTGESRRWADLPQGAGWHWACWRDGIPWQEYVGDPARVGENQRLRWLGPPTKERDDGPAPSPPDWTAARDARLTRDLEAGVRRSASAMEWPPPVNRLVRQGALIGVTLDLSRRHPHEQARLVRDLLAGERWTVRRGGLAIYAWASLGVAGVSVEVSEEAALLLEPARRAERIAELRAQIAELEGPVTCDGSGVQGTAADDVGECVRCEHWTRWCSAWSRDRNQ